VSTTCSKIFLRPFRQAVETPQRCGSRSIGEQIIGSLTDFRAVEIRRLFLIRVRKKKTRLSRQGNLIIMGLQLNHHSDEGHQK